MAATAKELAQRFRQTTGREPDQSEREQILYAAFQEQIGREPTPEEVRGLNKAAVEPWGISTGAASSPAASRPTLPENIPYPEQDSTMGRLIARVAEDTRTPSIGLESYAVIANIGGMVDELNQKYPNSGVGNDIRFSVGKDAEGRNELRYTFSGGSVPRPALKAALSKYRLRPQGGVSAEPSHRKLYSGGAFSDAMDFLSSGSRASAALAGSLANPEGGGYLERYRNPDTSYGKLIDELAPNADKSFLGRVGTGVGGFVGDVLLDPTTYLAVGAAGKLGKIAKEGEGLVSLAAKGGLAALDPIGTALKPVGAVARKIPGVSDILENIAARAESRNAVREIIREERTATGAKAFRTAETAQGLKDTARTVARSAENATPGDVRAGVGRVLDAGYDAARQAEKAETAAQGSAIRAARKELTIPARGKMARTEGALKATQNAAVAADTLLSGTQAKKAAAASQLEELLATRDALKGRLGKWTADRVGKVKGGQDAAARLSKRYMALADKLEAADKGIQDLTEQIGKREETLGGVSVSRKNLIDIPSSPGGDAVSKWLDAHNLKTEDMQAFGEALDRLDVERMLRKEAESDAGSIDGLLRQVTGEKANANPYYHVTPTGKAGKRKVAVYSIGGLDEREKAAFRQFMTENGGDTSRRYATRASRSVNPDNPTIVRGSAPEEFDDYYPVADVREALLNYRAKQRGAMRGLKDAVSEAEARYNAARKALREATTPFQQAKARDRAIKVVMQWDREDALDDIARLTAERDKAMAGYKSLAGKAREAARSFNAQAAAGKLHLGPEDLKSLTDALKAHDKVLGQIAETRGRISALDTAARAQSTHVGRLTARADKLAPVVAARQEAYQGAREQVFGPAAKAARRLAVTEAGVQAKAPAMEGAVSDLQAAMGLTPEGTDLLRGAIGKVQQAGNASGDALVDAGILKPSTVAANQDVYAKRLYEKNVNPDDYLQGLRDDPLAFLREEADQAGRYPGQGGANPMRRPTLRRKELDFETREGLGQIEDILPRFLRGEAESGAAAARMGTLNAMSERLAVPGLTDDAAAAAIDSAPRTTMGKVGDYLGLTENRLVRVPGQAKYGPLRGQYVPHEALQAFDRAIERPEAFAGAGGRVYDKALGIWKALKVPFNPPTRIANRVANYGRAYNELGVDPLTFLRYAYGAQLDVRGEGRLASGLHGLQRMLGKDIPRPEIGDAYRLAIETDPVFHGGLMGGYDEAIRSLRPPTRFGKVGDAIRTGLDYVGSGYGKAETVDKLAIFKVLLDRGETPEAAAAAVRKTLFDYGEAPYMADVLSKSGLMPFARYPFLALPAEALAFRARPDRYATAAKALLALQREGDTPDSDRGYEEQTMTGYQRGNAMMRVPGQDAAGRSRYLDLTRFLPAGNALSIGSSVASLNPLIGNPFGSMLTAATANRDTFTGGEVTDPDLPFTYRTSAQAKHALEDIMPSVAPGGIYWNQVARALRGEKDYEGVPYPVGPSLLRYGTGLTLRPVSSAGNLRWGQQDIERRQRALTADINRKARQGYDVTADIERANAEIQAATDAYNRETAR